MNLPLQNHNDHPKQKTITFYFISIQFSPREMQEISKELQARRKFAIFKIILIIFSQAFDISCDNIISDKNMGV